MGTNRTQPKTSDNTNTPKQEKEPTKKRYQMGHTTKEMGNRRRKKSNGRYNKEKKGDASQTRTIHLKINFYINEGDTRILQSGKPHTGENPRKRRAISDRTRNTATPNRRKLNPQTRETKKRGSHIGNGNTSFAYNTPTTEYEQRAQEKYTEF